MRLPYLVSTLTLAALSHAALIDRIAVIVGNSIIKDSDITREIRLTEFLNGDPPNYGPEARRAAATRLVDQVFIRREIRIGDYPTASLQRAQDDIKSLENSKFKTDSALQAALHSYGLTEADLEVHLQWQLTVLEFIDARFKPAAYTSDQEVTDYVNAHEAALKQRFPDATAAALRANAQTVMVGEKVNQLFFSWLDEQRKSAKVNYMEDSLK